MTRTKNLKRPGAISHAQAARMLRQGRIGVLPTDTLYGLVGRALDKKAVARIRWVKGRDENKALIILISKISDLNKFGLKPTSGQNALLKKLWPGKVSVILSFQPQASDERGHRHIRDLKYLHGGQMSLAFRLPGDKKLRALLAKTGPLVAPSANPQGAMPATNVAEAFAYFGDRVDFYIDGGSKSGQPSTIIKVLR